MKPTGLFALLALVVAIGLAFSVATPSVAMAQGAPPTAARPGGAAQAQVVDVQPTVMRSHGDIVESHGRGMALLFWVFAAASIAGAVFVISRRNLIAAVMGMVGSFMGIAAIYMMLYAQFLAVIQMLVYAGAIMVLFVFVIMILNRPEDEPVAPTGRIGQVLGGVAIIYLVGRLAMLLIHVELPNKAAALAAPQAVLLPPASQAANGVGEAVGWGTVKSVGNDLFTGGLFPFEAISILLLVAVVGAIAIARPLHSADGTSEDPGTHP